MLHSNYKFDVSVFMCLTDGFEQTERQIWVKTEWCVVDVVQDDFGIWDMGYIFQLIIITYY